VKDGAKAGVGGSKAGVGGGGGGEGGGGGGSSRGHGGFSGGGDGMVQSTPGWTRGQLLVAKVFLGKCTQEAAGVPRGKDGRAPKLRAEAYGEFNSVYRQGGAG